jgi:signal transduction histidine kinase
LQARAHGFGPFCQQLTEESQAATEQRCPIILKENGSLVGAQADEGLLRHIFGNLLTNAIKYSAPGAEVEFAVRKQDTDAIFVVRDSWHWRPQRGRKTALPGFSSGR